MQLEKGKEFLDLACQGHVAFNFIYSASQDFDLFTVLEESGGLTNKEIAQKLELREYPLSILLKGLLTLKMVEKNNDKYVNTPVASKYLVKSSPHNVTPILGWQREIVYPGIVDFTDALKAEKNIGLRNFKGDEPNLYGRLKNDPHKERVFHESMSYISKQANADLPDLHDFAKYKYLVDVGGGDASNCMALAKRNPDLKLTVFDQESICKLADQNIAKHGYTKQIDTQAGDIFSAPIPKGADALFFGHFFTIWSPEENIKILNTCYDYLPKGGEVVIYNMISNSEGTGPITPILGSAYFLTIATGKGQLYSEQDYQDWAKQTKFSDFKVYKDIEFDHALMVATK